MAYDIKKLNEDLKRDLANLEIKKHVTFHKGDQVHEKPVKQKNREDRRNVKRNLRRGDWE